MIKERSIVYTEEGRGYAEQLNGFFSCSKYKQIVLMHRIMPLESFYGFEHLKFLYSIIFTEHLLCFKH